MSKLIVEISDEKHKDLKYMALELDTTLKVIVQSILAVDKSYDEYPITQESKSEDK